MDEMEKAKHKSFTINTGLLLSSILVLAIMTGLAYCQLTSAQISHREQIIDQNGQIEYLRERNIQMVALTQKLNDKIISHEAWIKRLEDSDKQMDDLKQKLFENFMRKGE